MVKFINCTGFPAVMWGKKNKNDNEKMPKDDCEEVPIMVFDVDPSYTVSLQKEYHTVGTYNNIPVRVFTVSEINGLPEPEPDTIFIVHQQILDYINRYTDRTDFVCLTDKVNKKFDENGNMLQGKIPSGTKYTVKQVGYRSFCYGNTDDIGEVEE